MHVDIAWIEPILNKRSHPIDPICGSKGLQVHSSLERILPLARLCHRRIQLTNIVTLFYYHNKDILSRFFLFLDFFCFFQPISSSVMGLAEGVNSA